MRPPDRQDGTDESDSVRVTVDARARVQNVEVSRRWPERLDPTQLPAAIFAAYTSAVQQAFTSAAASALAAEQDRAEPDLAQRQRFDDEPTATALPSAGDPADDREWLAAIWSTLDDVHATLSRTAGSAARGARADDTTVSSPHGHLVVHLRGRGLTGITGNPRQIRTATAEQLRAEALAVFRAAGLTGEHQPADRR
jgi:hypothetical protein